MLKTISKRFTYANVAATLALLFAMTGGAYAANKLLITSTKQISPKVLKALKGASGKNGAAGPAGPAGAPGVGTAGAVGPQGPAGGAGEKGIQGEKGEKGEQGVKGAAGSPWTAGGKLPLNATETGTWSLTIGKAIFGVVFGQGVAPISFTVPLAAAVAEANIKIEPVGYKGTEEECPGTAANAEAASGFLCIYEASDETEAPAELREIRATTPNGVVLSVFSEKEGHAAYGTWAVTG
jgi:hypothetical protein